MIKILEADKALRSDLTIVSSGYNIKSNIVLLIKSFLKFHPNYKNNLIVFDDNSDDGTKEWLEENNIKRITWKNKDYINNKLKESNITFRVNLIIKEIIEQVQTQYLFVLDGDIIILKEFMNELLEEIKECDIIGLEDFVKAGSYSASKVTFPKDLRKYELCLRNDNKNFSRLWFGFVFLNLKKIKEYNLIFDDINNNNYNSGLNGFFDSGVDFYYKVLLNNFKIEYINYFELFSKYIYHFAGRSVYERGIKLDTDIYEYSKDKRIPKYIQDIIKSCNSIRIV